MLHLLTHFFKHGSKHVHKAAHHATKHIAPTLGQIAAAASVVNTGMSLYDRLKKSREVSSDNGGSTSEEEKALYNDFLLHIENLDKTIQTCKSEIQSLKDKNTLFGNDIQALSIANVSFDTLTKRHSEELLKQKEAINKVHSELGMLKAESKSAIESSLKAKKVSKILIVAYVFLLIFLVIASAFFYSKV